MICTRTWTPPGARAGSHVAEKDFVPPSLLIVPFSDSNGAAPDASTVTLKLKSKYETPPFALTSILIGTAPTAARALKPVPLLRHPG